MELVKSEEGQQEVKQEEAAKTVINPAARDDNDIKDIIGSTSQWALI